MRRLAAISLLGGALATATACGSDDEPLHGPPSATTTTHSDAGCGDDCDAGPDVVQPDPCETATEPTAGCECETPGEQVYCGQAYAKIGDQVVCGPGFMTCEADSHWGECILNNAAKPPPT